MQSNFTCIHKNIQQPFIQNLKRERKGERGLTQGLAGEWREEETHGGSEMEVQTWVGDEKRQGGVLAELDRGVHGLWLTAGQGDLGAKRLR